MQALIENLPALAKRDFPLLRRALRRRRRGLARHDRGDQAARAEAGARLRRSAGGAGDSRRPRHRGAGFRLAGRAQYKGAAARAGQRGLRGRDPARRQAGRGPPIRLHPTAGGELADQEPRTARAHHPQCRERDRAPAGLLPARRRVGSEAAQSQDGRRSDRRARIRRSRARPRTSSSRRRAACSR